MIRFLDGPAQGVTLPCARAPLFLRAVLNSVGGWDALDQLTDEPDPFERIEVYQLHGHAGSVHYDGINLSTGRRFGRTEMTGDYKYFPDQPSDQIVRDKQQWQAWATEQKRLLLEKRENEAHGSTSKGDGPGIPQEAQQGAEVQEGPGVEPGPVQSPGESLGPS